MNNIHLEKPLCESNKTKATFTETPPQSLPLAAELILSVYDHKLSQLEKVELRDYKKRDKNFMVHFLGDISSRTHAPDDEEFDDDRGDYIAKKGSNIYFRYEILTHIGKGSFGKVYIAFDHKDKKETALKILRSFPKDKSQIDLEPEILMYMKKNCIKNNSTLNKYHIIDIQDYFEFRLHKCITMPIYEMNLYEKIKELNFEGFTIDILRRMTIQLLR